MKKLGMLVVPAASAALVLLPGASAHAAGTAVAKVTINTNYSACGAVTAPSNYLVTVTLTEAGAQYKSLAATDTPSGTQSATGFGGATACVPGGFIPDDGAVTYNLTWTATNTSGIGVGESPGNLPVACVTLNHAISCSPNTAAVPLLT